MTAEELMRRNRMVPHEERGAFAERHYTNQNGTRAASGAIYYYVAPGERTAFHRIDCDEYWCYHCGEPLEVCLIDESGIVKVIFLGIGENCEPLLLMNYTSRDSLPVRQRSRRMSLSIGKRIKQT